MMMIQRSVRRTVWLLGLFILGIISLWMWRYPVFPNPAPAPIDLSVGINLSRWMQNDGMKQSAEWRDRWTNESDFQELSQLGVTHVRLPIDPQFLQDPRKPTQLIPEHLAYVDRAVQWANQHRLTIVLNHHPAQGLDLAKGSKSTDYQLIQDFWVQLAKHYQGQKGAIVYEPFNEPRLENGKIWHDITQTLVTKIRQIDTTHAIVIGAPRWSTPEDMVNLIPVTDKNVIYTFHFYHPMAFTHQGAVWVPPLNILRNIPYPFNRDRIAEILQQNPNFAETEPFWSDYARSEFNRDTLAQRLQPVIEFQKRYKVPVYCGEFGAYGAVAPKGDRYTWHQDVTTLLKQAKIGYSLWEYKGGFGLKPYDQAPIDAELATAIGLKMPS